MSSSNTSRQSSSSQSSGGRTHPQHYAVPHVRSPTAHQSTSDRSSTSANSSYYPGENRSSQYSTTYGDHQSHARSASHQSSNYTSHTQEDGSAYSYRPQPSPSRRSEQPRPPRSDNRSSGVRHPSSAMNPMERYLDSPETHSRYSNEHHRSNDPYHAIGYATGRWQHANRGYDASVSSSGAWTGQKRR